MHSFSAGPASSHYTTRIHSPRIHPVLTSSADEICGTLARLIAYLMVLALIAIGGISAWNQLPEAIAMAPAAKESWGGSSSPAGRSSPAFAGSQLNLQDKTNAYDILRHSEGGRKDACHWSDGDKKPVAELEIYRPGGEQNQSGPAIAELRRTDCATSAATTLSTDWLTGAGRPRLRGAL
jgi:hypothetical protein